MTDFLETYASIYINGPYKNNHLKTSEFNSKKLKLDGFVISVISEFNEINVGQNTKISFIVRNMYIPSK